MLSKERQNQLQVIPTNVFSSVDQVNEVQLFVQEQDKEYSFNFTNSDSSD